MTENSSAENSLYFLKREDERVNTVASERTRAETQVHTRRLGAGAGLLVFSRSRKHGPLQKQTRIHFRERRKNRDY